MTNKLLLALGGATGSGKTALAIELAAKNQDLVILSADSRQIYKQLNIGTAKVGRADTDSSLTGEPEPVWREQGVPQFLIDIAEPNTTFTFADYQVEAYRLIRAAWDQGKIPLLVGGTGLYIEAVTEGFEPQTVANPKLREKLESLPVAMLQATLISVGQSLPLSDWSNKRRLIRAIERAESGEIQTKKQPITSNTAVFVLECPWEEQRNLAPAMVKERLDLGLIHETHTLLAQGIDKVWLAKMGLSYRLVIRYLDGELSATELEERMVYEFRQLMRRQRTWFNRMPHAQKGGIVEIEKLVEERINISII